jgi:phosphatidylserine/phosphatidylglycerophosphate/cardiolipin synthase-like enzyme
MKLRDRLTLASRAILVSPRARMFAMLPPPQRLRDRGCLVRVDGFAVQVLGQYNHQPSSGGTEAMRRWSISLGLLSLAALFVFARPAQTQPSGTSLPIDVYFSPQGGCTEAVVHELEAARASVLVQAYSFTSAPIAKALVDAHRRGVRVQVILDKGQRTEKYSSATFLLDAGVPTAIDAAHAIAHNKVMVIDGGTIITGSFNFTTAAEQHNAENLLVIRDRRLAETYAANWDAHARHSQRYEGRETAAPAGKLITKQVSTVAQPGLAMNGYVTSKNSQVFHRANCGSAAKIAPRNLVRYSSREEAVSAGKKPCAECKP